MYALDELWADCPRVIGQTRLRNAKPPGNKMEIAAFLCLMVLLIALPTVFMVR